MSDAETGWPSWRDAMDEALYGPRGFYRAERPAAHFRTSVHTSPLFAAAVGELVADLEDLLGGAGPLSVVDMGAGRGELCVALAERVSADVELIAVDVGARPAELPERVGWRHELPPAVRGLLLANEWLDNVPVQVAEVDPQGQARLVHVDPGSGAERLGEAVRGADAAWLARHWPLDGAPPGSRAEIGTTRDAAWVNAVSRLQAGVAVAVDYHHTRGARPPLGTLAGYRAGRQVTPVPDGTSDLTAHVALDACAVAVEASGLPVTTSVRPQRDVLRALGVRAHAPPRELASSDPSGYLRRLVERSEAAALCDPAGLGAFGWLAHARGVPLPAALLG